MYWNNLNVPAAAQSQANVKVGREVGPADTSRTVLNLWGDKSAVFAALAAQIPHSQPGDEAASDRGSTDSSTDGGYALRTEHASGRRAPGHCFVVAPHDISLYATLARNQASASKSLNRADSAGSRPFLQIELDIGLIDLWWHDHQWVSAIIKLCFRPIHTPSIDKQEELLSMLVRFGKFELAEKYSHMRPTERPKRNATRVWWRYALSVIKGEILARHMLPYRLPL